MSGIEQGDELIGVHLLRSILAHELLKERLVRHAMTEQAHLQVVGGSEERGIDLKGAALIFLAACLVRLVGEQLVELELRELLVVLVVELLYLVMRERTEDRIVERIVHAAQLRQILRLQQRAVERQTTYGNALRVNVLRALKDVLHLLCLRLEAVRLHQAYHGRPRSHLGAAPERNVTAEVGGDV